MPIAPLAKLLSDRALTARQQMFWLEDELHPGIPRNNLPTRLVVRGSLDPERFVAAFAEVSLLFDVFRTRVVRRAGQLVQQLSPEPAAPVEIVDLRQAQDGDRTFAEWLQQRCAKSFGLGDPLIDAALVAVGPDHWVFYFNQHHSIGDGQSSILLHDALERAYRGEQPRMAASFSELLDDESAYRSSEQFDADRAFWEGRFANRPEPQRLYGRDPRRKAALTERINHILPRDLSRAIWELSPEVSLSQQFATTLFAYLRVVTGCSDLSIGVPLLNRSERFRDTVGLLMEVCPTRVVVDQDATFASILADVREHVAAVREHRRFPMSSRFGGYEVLLNVHSESRSSFADMPAIYLPTTPLNVLEDLPGERGGVGWDGLEALTVQVHHAGPDRRLVVKFDCNCGLFADHRLRRGAVEHFTSMLAGFVADRETRIHAIDLLTADERAVLFPQGGNRHARVERPASVLEQFASQVARVPDATALVHGRVELSYRELDTRIRRMATILRERDVGRGDLVGICLDRSVDLVVALLATMRVGAAYLPIDPHHPADRTALILEDARPRLLIGTTATRSQLVDESGDRLLLLDAVRKRLEAAAPDAAEPTAADVAYVIFTSGSTGRPKGVRVKHLGLSTFLAAMADEPGLSETDRLLAVTTISFDIAALELFLPLTVGASIHLADASTASDGEALARLLIAADITVLQATPTTYRMLIRTGWAGKPDLQALCGGETMSAELAEALLPRVRSLWNMYGPTETTIWSTTHHVVSSRPPIPIGHPIRGTQTFVLNDHLLPVPIGVAGELFIAGDGVAEGYHDRPERTAERFVVNRYSTTPGARMYRTGDFARVQPNGELEYIARADCLVKIRGFRVELGEIESVLEEHEHVVQAVVVARPDASGEMGLIGYLIPTTSAWDVGSVRDHLRRKLTSYMVPPILVPLDEFSLTPNGKVDRKVLPELQEAEIAWDHRDFVAPRNDLETRLALIWEELLGLPRIGIHESFFDLAGHSMLAVEMAQRILEELGASVELAQLFSTPTVAELAAALETDSLTVGRSVIPLQPRGEGTPVYCVSGIQLYQGLARSVGGGQPFYGLYIPEEDEFLTATQNGDESADSVRRLAEAYYAAIKEHSGDGPMSLLGFCFGGVLAFEVARLATRDGLAVDRLILVDSPLWTRMRRGPWIRARYHFRKLLEGGAGYVVERLRARRAASRVATLTDRATREATGRILAFREQARLYSPEGTFAGRVVFVRTTDLSHMGAWAATPLRGWEGVLTGEISLIDVGGSHRQIFEEPSVEEFASKLTPLLEGPSETACPTR